ncbi:hypothetical protein SEA_MAGRITTE_122 [Microbacterium phage Magritte]|nr:hypothetical protein SEA_MAGRITTE_122 [Microbacterium phage Magritte]
MAEDTKFDRREFQIERIRETARFTAKQLRRLADDIDRIADKDDYVAIPHEVMNAVVWGVANARPDSPAQQLRELMISDQADITIAARKAQEQAATAEAARRTPQDIAEQVTTGSVGGHSGISDSTRRIAYNAAVEALLIERGEECSECHAIVQHKFGCSQRAGTRGYVLPAEYVEEGVNR